MFEFICYSLVWIFAIYGFIEILKILYYTFIMKMPKISNTGIHIIIETKNCENQIESFIRTFFFRITENKILDSNRVVVIDMNSTDNTKSILKKLNEDYDFEYRELE